MRQLVNSLLLIGLFVAPYDLSAQQALAAQQATILYVNRTDRTCGGFSPCYTTIQAAINAAGPRSVIHIQNGTYAEQLSISGKNNFQGATEIDRIIIEADPATQPGQVILTGSPGACTGNYAIRLQQSKFITIRGLTITGTGGQAISLLGGNNQNQDIHIELNRIFGNGSSSCDGGITVARGNPGTLIVNNLIYANGRNGVSFSDADGGPHYLINNTISGNQWNGIDVARNHTITLANNIINSNGTASGTTGGRFGVARENSNNPQPAGITLLNNLVCGNRQGQISAQILDSTDSGNLTPVGNEGIGVTAFPGCEIPANLFANKDGLDRQPNTADDDFSLKRNSLAIDIGMDPRTLGLDPAFNVIFEADSLTDGIRPADGNADRITAFDAGAFEFPNAPPMANAGANQTAHRGQLVTLNGTLSSDPEGSPLTFQWTILSQPGGSNITLTGATTATPTFTPQVFGSYAFQLVVNDGQFNSAPSTAAVSVVNVGPTANDISATTNEDTPVNITITATDIDSASLTFTVVSGPSHGTLSASSGTMSCANSNCSANVTYTPVANYNGPDVFTFNANDGVSTSNTATVSITVNPVNDPPVANNVAVTTNEETPVAITLTASDIDSPNLTFTVVSGPSHGVVIPTSGPMTCSSGGSCTASVIYTPAANFNSLDSFSFRASDGQLSSNIATASITVNNVNDPPTANGISLSTNEDNALVITLGGSDIDSTNLTFAIQAGPSHGSLGPVSSPSCITIPNSEGVAGSSCTATVTYIPAANYNGPDSFTFKANDSALDSNIATVSITVQPVNDAPVASNDTAITNEDNPVLVTLRATDIDSSSLTFSIVGVPSNGVLGPIGPASCSSVPNGTGTPGVNCIATVTYTPSPNYGGSDSVTFKVNDGSLDSNIATVGITVSSVNDASVAANDFYATDKDTPLSIGAPGVLANDNDVDNQPSNFIAALVNAPTHAASFTLNADGSFTYTPATNFTGTDSFTYKTNDGANDSNEATVTIAVIQPGNVPIATNDFYNTEKDTPLNVPARGVFANDNDADTPAANLVALLVTGPARAASFTLNPDGSFDYTPAADFTGADSFTYKVNDGASDSNIAMVSIAVLMPNTFPVAKNDAESTNEDAARSVSAPGVLGNDAFALLTTPTAVLVSGPRHALSFALNPDGSFSYIPVNDYYGSDSFTYRVFDGTKYSNVAMVNIDVVAVNDAPVALPQTISTNQNTTVIITLAASDIDSKALTFNITAPPTHGSLGNISALNCTIQGQGATCTATVTYTPAANYYGLDSFSFTASDGRTLSALAAVSITVIQVNQAPTANAGGPYTGVVGVPVQFNGSGNDPDGNPISFSWTFGDGGKGTSSNLTHTYSAPGTYPVILTVTDTFNTSGLSQTTATISPALVLNPIGNRIVNLGETLTFTVSAAAGTGGIVRLYVAPLPLMTNAIFDASTGVFTFRPSTLQVGSYQLTFSASDGVNSASETINITVPNPPPGGTTGVRGRVVNLAQTPLSNVRITVKSSGHTALSGGDGLFTITGTPSGTQQLIVNGREANLGVYAILAVAVDLIDGVLNILASPITLPDVDVAAEVAVSPIFNTIVSNPSLPGVEVEIISGSATNPDGTPFTGKLSINAVPDYGRPESRPEELRPGMAVTIQPAGIRFNPPARITFPNADGMAPGNELNLWSLSPDTGKFNIVGKMAVAADGQSFITVEGGVVASAWHFPLASSPTPVANQGNSFCGSCRVSVGSESNLEEGSLFISHALPSYRSLGQSRGLSLTYSSVAADPRPIISLDTTLSVRAAVPNTFSTRLKVGGVQQGGEVFTDTRSLPEDSDSISRLSVQFDAANLTTGRYPYEATVFSNYLNSSIGGITNGNVIVVNRKSSSLGSGWAITELQQLYLQSGSGAFLSSGDGTALFFSGGPDMFTSPAGDFSVLMRNTDGTYTRSLKDGTKINFDAQGLETAIVDRNANATSFVYDGNGRLISIADPVGLVTTLAYANGKLQTITDPAGRQTSFQFDSAGNLTRITNPDKSFVAYGYDAQGHLTQATDERGNSGLYAYDFAGRFKQSTRPGGETRSLVATKLQGLADTAGGQGTPISPAPIVQTQNATASLTDGRGGATRFALDSLGQVTSQTDALGQVTATQRDANGLPTRITRPNGAVTTMTYDAKGNLLTSTDPLGATTTFTYEPNFNQVKTIRDPKGNITTVNYDVKGNPSEIIDALNSRTQMTYESHGLLASVTSAVGTSVQTTTSFTYDAKGNLLTTTNPKGDVTTLAYDSPGNVSTSTDAENRVTQFSYDPRNRLITVLDADLKTTQYGYDSKGNLTQVRDAKNQITAFTYDALDRLVSATNPLGLAETFIYDGNGNLASTTNRNGQTMAFNYDPLNRLISKTRPPTSMETGSQVTNFAYDAVGNLRSVSSPVTSVINQYDLANRLVSSLSATEIAQSDTVVPINVDTTIGENDFQFEGKTIQVNGKTLVLDGLHVFANLILVNGAVLTHTPTTSTKLNRLEVTVTGTLQVDAASRIDATGRGFLGGGQPGNPFGNSGMTLGLAQGSGTASGASYGGAGGFANSGPVNATYGDFRNPSDPGSGGGTIFRIGGNGGGVLRITAQTLDLNGQIKADGGAPVGDSFAAAGSGGGIRIDVGTLRGVGQISANASNSLTFSGGSGGGRIAIYYQDASAFDLARITAFGGGGTSSNPNGGAGTVYLQGPGREVGELMVDNNSLAAAATTVLPAGQLNLTNLTVRRGKLKISDRVNLAGALSLSSSGELTLGSALAATSINLNSGSVIFPFPTTASAFSKIELSANTITVDATSRIDATALGFLGGGQSGNNFAFAGMTLGFQAGSEGFSGGGYGGVGGIGSGTPSTANSVYGDFRNPNEPGSGGAGVLTAGRRGGNGGGLIRIIAQSMNLNGQIIANGGSFSTDCCEGGGSGGGIRIDAGTLAGTGSISARGGNGNNGGAGGGGGRIAVYYQDVANFNLANVTAFGGTGSNAPVPNGGAGTVYLQGPEREMGELIVDNNNISAASQSTRILATPSGMVGLTHLRVRKQASLRLDNLVNLTEALDVSSNGEVMAASKIIADTVAVTSNSAVTQIPTTATSSFKIDLSARLITIDATSRIDAIGRGFLGGQQPGNPFGGSGMTLGFVQGSTGTSGGSYGGLGGAPIGNSNSTYGTAQDPKDPGSGGGTLLRIGGKGGGVVKLSAQSLTINGSVRVDGGAGTGDSFAGGGSGGSIRMDIGTLTGSGQISARGGSGLSVSGGGGGGRVAIYYSDATNFNLAAQVSVSGGAGASAANGQAGTIYLQQQVAMLSPETEEAPVMTAEAQENRFARIAALRDGCCVQPAHENLYLALLAKTAELKSQEDLDPVYSYDPNGNRVSMIDPTGLTTYAYDALNRLAAITNNKGQVTSFTYDALGRRRSMTHANGVTTNYTYDAASQLLTLAHQLGATTINSFAYTYDKVGNRKSKADTNGTANYAYDVLNRLVQATNPLPTNPLETFNYDAVGNRINSNQNGLSNFNQANELLDDANFVYQYDNNGNMIRKTAKVGGAVTQYEYDAENKLIRVVSPGSTANYRYDGLGRRVEKEVIAGNTTINRYVYDNEDILLELDGSNNIVARYTHGPGIDEPLIMEKNGQSFFYHADGLSSITEITNQSGTVVQRYGYSSFGKIESQFDLNFKQPYTYTARELDVETGLYYYRARYYDIQSGRFLQTDPNGFSGGINFYGYVGNNPIGRIDPYGLDWLDALSNFSAGTGDYLTGGFMNSLNFSERVLGSRAIPLTEFARHLSPLGDPVDRCSMSYKTGEYTGFVIGTSLILSAGLNAGANTVTWSGYGQQAASEALQLEGTTIGATPIGHSLELLQYQYNVPLGRVWTGIWAVSSAVFAGNASGPVQAVIREAGFIWTKIELPILLWRGIPIIYK
jgi:RHS repeat-associated protein